MVDKDQTKGSHKRKNNHANSNRYKQKHRQILLLLLIFILFLIFRVFSLFFASLALSHKYALGSHKFYYLLLEMVQVLSDTIITHKTKWSKRKNIIKFTLCVVCTVDRYFNLICLYELCYIMRCICKYISFNWIAIERVKQKLSLYRNDNNNNVQQLPQKE